MSDTNDKTTLSVIHVLLFFASSLSLSNFIRKRHERRNDQLTPKTPNRLALYYYYYYYY